MMRKGLTPAVATILLIVITIGAAGTLYTLMQEQQANARQMGNTKIIKNPDSVYVEHSWFKNSSFFVSLRNDRDVAANLSIIQLDQQLTHTVVRPKSTGKVNLGCVPQSPSPKIQTRSRYKEIIVEPMYCINITDTYIKGGIPTEKVWKGKVFLNDFNKTPYSNKNLSVTIDGSSNYEDINQVLNTDKDGNFKLSIPWETVQVHPESGWSKSITYYQDANTVDFHSDRGKFQPPNRVRLDFEDGTSQSYQTQEVFKEPESNKISSVFDIVPVNLTDNSITFNVSVNLKAKIGLKQDWKSHPETSLLYQIPLAESGSYADIIDLSCSTGENISCSTGEVTQHLESSTNGRVYHNNSLPTKDNRDKYIPVEMNASATGMPFLGSLTSFSYFKYDGSWVRVRVDEREIYVLKGNELNFTQPVEPSRVESVIEDRYQVSDISAEGNYRQYYGLVGSIDRWWNPPNMAEADARYALDESLDSTGSPASKKMKTVLYNWSSIKPGESYRLNFTVKLDRSSSATTFMLPLSLGTFGLFPEEGGKAIQIYNKGGVRYPYYGQSGSYDFAMKIPSKDTEQALVYKITKPVGTNKWRSKTYVLNTADRKIENIYLLNSQGIFTELEDLSSGDISGGEEISKTINLDSNKDKKVQLNMQYQTIDGSITNNNYPDWPYTAFLNVSGKEDYNFDISGKVRCGEKYCINYRTGNRDEARRIDNLRGKSTSKSVFSKRIDSVRFYMKNGDPNDGNQNLKNLGIWIWYMQPYTDNLKDELLERPDRMKIETLSNSKRIHKGVFKRVF
ncbi:MAG: archaellin/type IV pilin N-terminal domain-containing protein [Candidatus Nanohalobium sp.]